MANLAGIRFIECQITQQLERIQHLEDQLRRERLHLEALRERRRVARAPLRVMAP